MGGNGAGGGIASQQETFKNPGFSATDTSVFASSSLASSYSPSQINELTNGQIVQSNQTGLYGTEAYTPQGNQGPSGYSNYFLDSSNNENAMAQAFVQWKADQTNAANTWDSYANLVQQQNGGEGTSTILGNPMSAMSESASTYQSILAAMDNPVGSTSTPGAVGNPAAITSVGVTAGKSVGAT
jgi:hypothetical protein